MVINANVMTGGSLDYLTIVEHPELATMTFLPIEQITYITSLYLVYAIFFIESKKENIHSPKHQTNRICNSFVRFIVLTT